ncbi:MAG: carboxypeptidase regulatory-like domain-containing protein [Candidatus Hydrogenedentes bacterium]|nr:carboxypeptidase regulatory-like domain-containing protein [Candidatus Hydrogenedentota bacterium]
MADRSNRSPGGKCCLLLACAIILILAGFFLVRPWDRTQPTETPTKADSSGVERSLHKLPENDKEPSPLFVRSPSEGGKGDKRPQSAALTLQGIITNKSRSPVEGAEIFLERLDTPVVAASDLRGLFEITQVPAGAAWLIVRHPDYAQERVSIVTAAEEGVVLQITLMKGAALTGTVTSDGRTLEGQTVEIGKNVGFWGASHEYSAKTNARGIYEFTHIKPRVIDVEACLRLDVSEGSPERRLRVKALLEDGETTVVDFDFRKWEASLEGQVLFNGDPVQNGYISLWSRNSNGACETFTEEINEEGFYQFDALPAGTLDVTVDFGGDGETSYSRRSAVEIPPGFVTTQDFLFEGKGVVTGRCLGLEQYDRYPSIALLLRSDISDLLAEDGWEETLRTLDVDEFDVTGLDLAEDGSFEAEGLEAGNYTLIVLADLDIFGDQVTYTFAPVTVSESQEAYVVVGPDYITEHPNPTALDPPK